MFIFDTANQLLQRCKIGIQTFYHSLNGGLSTIVMKTNEKGSKSAKEALPNDTNESKNDEQLNLDGEISENDTPPELEPVTDEETDDELQILTNNDEVKITFRLIKIEPGTRQDLPYFPYYENCTINGQKLPPRDKSPSRGRKPRETIHSDGGEGRFEKPGVK